MGSEQVKSVHALQVSQNSSSGTYTTIHLVRHGEVFNPDRVLYERLPDFHLSERGLRMAHATGKYISQRNDMNTPSAIFASPLERTVETVSAIVEELTVGGNATRPFETDERLIEARNEFRGKRIGYGDGALWSNGNWKLVTNLWRPSWGESYKEIAQRIGDFVYEKVDQHPGGNVLCVTHESPIWSFRHLLETGHPEHNMLLRKVGLASITSFTFEVGTHKLVYIEYVDPASRVA